MAREERRLDSIRDQSTERDSSADNRRFNDLSNQVESEERGLIANDSWVSDEAEEEIVVDQVGVAGKSTSSTATTDNGVPSNAGAPSSAATGGAGKSTSSTTTTENGVPSNAGAPSSVTTVSGAPSNVWDHSPRLQSVVPKAGVPKAFQRVRLSFENIELPTVKEIDSFNLTRAFIGIHVSDNNQIDTIITTASFVDLSKSSKFDLVIPEVWKAPLTNVHMTYITIDTSVVSEQNAQVIMQTIAKDIKLAANSPSFFLGIDIGGNIGIKSRKGIESVIYSAKPPGPNDISDAIKKIVKSNVKLSSLLGCSAQLLVRKQIQFDNCLGVAEENVKIVISGLDGYDVSNFNFRAPPHIAHTLLPSEISTSDEIFLTLTCPENFIVPDSFLVPTISGKDKTIFVTKVFVYENHRTALPADLPVASLDPRFRTRECIYTKQLCPHGKRCLFAHGPLELRRKVVANQPRRRSPHSADSAAVDGVVPSSTAHLASFIKTHVFQQPVLSVPESIVVQNEIQPTPLTTTSTVLDSHSLLASGTDDEPFTMSHRGRSPPCGPDRPSLNMHVAPAVAKSTVASLTTASPGPTNREPVKDFSESAPVAPAAANSVVASLNAASPSPTNREPMTDLTESVPSTPYQTKSLGDGETRIHVSRISANKSRSGSGKSPLLTPSQPLNEAPVKKSPSVLTHMPSDSRFRASLTSPPSQSRPGISPISRASPPSSFPPKKARTSPQHNRVSGRI